MLIPLLNKISKNFPTYSRTCVKNFLVLSLCILLKEPLKLNKLKGVVGVVLGTRVIQSDSGYKRLIRIFDNHALSGLWLDILSFVFKLIGLEGDYLLLDGTSWKRGKKIYHYLTLCLIYQDVAIPIYWSNLKKLGVSSIEERISLIKKAKEKFNLRTKTLLADREYMGREWFNSLIDEGLNFVIRLRKNAYKKAVNQSEGKSYEALQAKVKRSKVARKALKKSFVLKGRKFYFVVLNSIKIISLIEFSNFFLKIKINQVIIQLQFVLNIFYFFD